MSVPHTFTAAGAQRIVNVVRRVEGQNFDGRTPPQPKPVPRGQGGFTQWVLVTSATQQDGRHPGEWSAYDVENDTWTPQGDCWVVGARAETLSVQRYLCRLQGTLAADNLPVFMTVDDGAAVGSTVAIVAVTSSTAAATPGSYAHYSCNTLSTDGNTFSTVTAARVMFPNNEVPAVGNYPAVAVDGVTSGGLPLYVALYLPLQVQATNAGTGDTDATVYGVTHLHFNQGSGLSVSYPATYKVKVAAADASKTHSGVVNLTADQVLGDGDKKFSDKLTVNEDQGTGVKFHVRKNTGSTPALEVTADGTVRVNTTATTYTLEVGGNGHFTTNLQVDTDIIAGDDITATDAITGAIINATTKFQANGIDGTGSDYVDGINTTIDFSGGIATSVT